MENAKVDIDKMNCEILGSKFTNLPVVFMFSKNDEFIDFDDSMKIFEKLKTNYKYFVDIKVKHNECRPIDKIKKVFELLKELQIKIKKRQLKYIQKHKSNRFAKFIKKKKIISVRKIMKTNCDKKSNKKHKNSIFLMNSKIFCKKLSEYHRKQNSKGISMNKRIYNRQKSSDLSHIILFKSQVPNKKINKSLNPLKKVILKKASHFKAKYSKNCLKKISSNLETKKIYKNKKKSKNIEKKENKKLSMNFKNSKNDEYNKKIRMKSLIQMKTIKNDLNKNSSQFFDSRFFNEPHRNFSTYISKINNDFNLKENGEIKFTDIDINSKIFQSKRSKINIKRSNKINIIKKNERSSTISNGNLKKFFNNYSTSNSNIKKVKEKYYQIKKLSINPISKKFKKQKEIFLREIKTFR